MARARRRRSRRPAYLVYEEKYVIDRRRAAELLNVSERTLERWRRRGEGPLWTKIGRYVRYSFADLSAFLESEISTTVPEGTLDTQRAKDNS